MKQNSIEVNLYHCLTDMLLIILEELWHWNVLRDHLDRVLILDRRNNVKRSDVTCPRSRS